MTKTQTDNKKIIARNKKALHEYFIEDKIEAGIVLLGSEVKSIRAGKISLTESFAKFTATTKIELFLYNCHISEYPWANINNHEPLRPKKLLLAKKQLAKLSQAVTQLGKTILPLAVYLKNGKIKLEIAIGKGKKLYDKRETLKKQDAKRDMERAI